MDQRPAKLTLRPISSVESGDPVRAVSLPADRPLQIGRSSDADWSIPDPSVSRRHASIERKAEDWFLTDLSSRHGTSVNDRRLDPGVPVPIQDGDIIAFGAWRCRCASGTVRPGVTTSFAPTHGNAESVSAIPAQQLGGVAQRGLEILMELTGGLDDATSRETVAQVAAEAVRSATGCRRVVLVEPDSGAELIVLASTTEEAPRVSRSLIEQASRQGLVQLTVAADQSNQAQSIMELGIRSAICAPITVGGSPTAFMMVDTRDAEGVVPKDAASFCQCVARLVGLAFQRISASTMAERHRQLQADLDAARRAQEMLSPSNSGRHGAVSYRFESIPGRIVAGDLFDIFPLDEGRVGFFLGDVSGKGVGAAMLMAACQSQLRSQLLSGADLGAAMAAVNADLHVRTESSKFVTLIAGIIDATQRIAQLVDAGHGLCVLVPDIGEPARIEATPGFPLGVVESTDYEITSVSISGSASLVLFSDGAVEQPDKAGSQFGIHGVLESLASSAGPDDPVGAIIDGVRAHAAGALADDLTVAALSIG